MHEPIEAIEDENMRFQANKDIANRSMTGSFIYLILWFTIIIPNQFYKTNPNECLWFSILIIASSVARTIMIKNFDRIYGRSPMIWKIFFFPLVLFSALAWGVLCAVSTVDPAFNDISFAILIATAGLTGGGGASIAPNRTLTICLITALLIPSGMAILLSPDTDKFTVGLIFFIYWLGMFSVTKVQYDEYWLSLKSSFLIKQHSEKLEELNTMDGLTGLKNRVFFDQSLRTELKRANRAQSPMSLLIMDIDNFKAVNDTFGHLMGDECLKALSKVLLNASKRETDVIARFGGEEFAIILPGINVEQTLLFAEKIRRTVEKIKLDKVYFTISIGITNTLPSIDVSDHMVIGVADKALYEAKAQGKNRVIYRDLA